MMKKLSIFVSGSFIMGMGIGMCNYANLGVDPMSVLVAGTYERLHVSFGMMNFLICVAQLLITICIYRKCITIATFIAMITTSLGIEAFALLPLWDSPALPIMVLSLVIGILIYCFGLSLSQFADAGYTTYDGVIFGIQRFTGWSYHKIRWIVDLFYLVSGALLGGSVGICTVVILLFAGKLVEAFLAFLKKHEKEKQGG